MLYQCLRSPFTPGLKALKGRKGLRHGSDWVISDLNSDEFAIIHVNIPGDSIGLGIKDVDICRYSHDRVSRPAKLLLLNDEMYYVETKYLAELTDVLCDNTETDSTGNSAVPEEPG